MVVAPSPASEDELGTVVEVVVCESKVEDVSEVVVLGTTTLEVERAEDVVVEVQESEVDGTADSEVWLQVHRVEELSVAQVGVVVVAEVVEGIEYEAGTELEKHSVTVTVTVVTRKKEKESVNQ